LEIIVATAEKAVARLVPYRPKGVIRRRRPGTMRGIIKIKRNFDDPLPKELLLRSTANLDPLQPLLDPWWLPDDPKLATDEHETSPVRTMTRS